MPLDRTFITSKFEKSHLKYMFDMCKLIHGNIGYKEEDNYTNLLFQLSPCEWGWSFKRKALLAYALHLKLVKSLLK
jgi:hypothetical protein